MRKGSNQAYADKVSEKQKLQSLKDFKALANTCKGLSRFVRTQNNKNTTENNASLVKIRNQRSHVRQP